MVLVVSQIRFGTRMGPTCMGEKRCSNCVSLMEFFSSLLR
jgi:hypothetical protein